VQQVGELRLRHVGDAGENVGEPSLRQYSGLDAPEAKDFPRIASPGFATLTTRTATSA